MAPKRPGLSVITHHQAAQIKPSDLARTYVVLPASADADEDYTPVACPTEQAFYDRFPQRVAVSLSRLDGEEDLESIDYRSADDFDEDELMARVPTLRSQRETQAVLEYLLGQLASNEAFVDRLQEPGAVDDLLIEIDDRLTELDSILEQSTQTQTNLEG